MEDSLRKKKTMISKMTENMKGCKCNLIRRRVVHGY